ncbi:uncharacterized protein LOC111392589 [Olea europaea var. sylvestris]|uniref:uncharacterized protein LOC111392589 n=1 Tax=Olea europaea var. sylvestris TaxID=158386 RepID=UPI000C1D0DC9|nr:uncharacterized protein LOC111392589 [Olea europaea var. sylvestris]
MASQDDLNKKRPVRPDFKTIQRMMAEAMILKTSSSAYKKQMEDLVAASKQLQPAAEEEEQEQEQEQEDPKAALQRKGKRAASSSKGPTVARAVPVLRQIIIPIEVAIKERMAAPATAPIAPRLLPSQSHKCRDLVAANSACIAEALSTSVQLQSLVKDLEARREDLAKRLEEALHYEDAMRAAQAKASEAEEVRQKAKARLMRSNPEVKRLKKELYEVECQVAAMIRRVHHANEHHRLATETLEASNKEKAELRQRVEAQAKEIESLKAEMKAARESAM